MGEWAAQNRHVNGAGQLNVVGPVSLTVQQSCIFLALDGAAQSRAHVYNFGHYLAPSMSSAAR